MIGSRLYIFGSCVLHSKPTRDVRPFGTNGCTSIWGQYQREAFFVVVCIHWTTNRNWQSKLLDGRKVTQLILLCQESVSATLRSSFPCRVILKHKEQFLWSLKNTCDVCVFGTFSDYWLWDCMFCLLFVSEPDRYFSQILFGSSSALLAISQGFIFSFSFFLFMEIFVYVTAFLVQP